MKFSVVALGLLSAVSLFAADAPPRPHIVGLSHMALYVHDLVKSRAFYKTFLGFDEPYSLTNKDGSLHLTWIKINDHQTLELFPEQQAGTDRLYHIALETDDAEGMRKYLGAHGVTVPDKTGKGKIGNENYFIKDPDGHFVEIVQYDPDGWTMRNQGKFMPDTRISTHIPHMGILVGDLTAAQKFYGDVLGFKEIWRGAKNPKQLSWVHEQVPDGKDFIEFMLYSTLPDADKRGTAHHFCLEVPDIEKAKATLEQRAAQVGYTKPLTIQTGVNRKRQLNVYDPDGTRVELMEPTTVDRVPAPASTAPPPRPTSESKSTE
jgi:lactoylglutathione lyase